MTTQKITRLTQLQSQLEGIDKQFASATSLMLGGVEVTKGDLIKIIQAEIDAIKATGAAKAECRICMEAEKLARTHAVPVLRSLKRLVIAQYGDTPTASQVLEVFGYAPKKVSTRTLEQRRASAQKGKATRAARHTLGPKQKARIKGVVEPVVSATPLPPATPPTTPHP